MKSREFICIALLIVFSIGCSTPRIRVNPEIDSRHLPGKWTSNKGTVFFGCNGDFDFIGEKSPYLLDVRYDEIKGATVLEIHPNFLLIRTFPFHSEKFEMAEYPVENRGRWTMKFYGAEWEKVKETYCTEDPADFLKRNSP